MIIAEKARPVANPLIVLREEFDDWAILFDPDTGKGMGLNPTGVFIWKLLDGSHTLNDILEKLRGECENVPEDAGNEIKAFIQELTGRGLAGFEVAGG
jgi:SynChlorMet cassette protein ScmD